MTTLGHVRAEVGLSVAAVRALAGWPRGDSARKPQRWRGIELVDPATSEGGEAADHWAPRECDNHSGVRLCALFGWCRAGEVDG